MEALRNSLKVHRARHDLTQEALAAKAGVTRRTINAIEGDKMVPSVLLALKIARVLQVPIEALFRLEGEPAKGAGSPVS